MDCLGLRRKVKKKDWKGRYHEDKDFGKRGETGTETRGTFTSLPLSVPFVGNLGITRTTDIRGGGREGDKQCSEPTYPEPVKTFSFLLKSEEIRT